MIRQGGVKGVVLRARQGSVVGSLWNRVGTSTSKGSKGNKDNKGNKGTNLKPVTVMQEQAQPGSGGMGRGDQGRSEECCSASVMRWMPGMERGGVP